MKEYVTLPDGVGRTQKGFACMKCDCIGMNLAIASNHKCRNTQARRERITTNDKYGAEGFYCRGRYTKLR